MRYTIDCRRCLVLAAFAALAACGSSNSFNDPSPNAIVTEYGALTPRLAALAAFKGTAQPTSLDMTRYTVEGVPTYWHFTAEAGRAILVVDNRADGGAVRTDTISQLSLVRYVPSVWANNVETAKERLEVVGPGASLPAGTYLLIDTACLPTWCGRFF